MTSQPNFPKNEDLLESIRLDRDDPQDPYVQRLVAILRENPGLAKRYADIRRQDVETGNLLRQGRDYLGLEERIFARLSCSEQTGGDSVQTVLETPKAACAPAELRANSSEEVSQISTILGPQGSVRRRQWLRWLIGTATAGAVAGIGLWAWRTRKSTPQLSAGEFGSAVTELFEATLDGFGTGRDLAKESPTQGYRLSRDVRLFRGTVVTWRELVVLDHPVVAFDITHPGGEQGSLFATRWIIAGLHPIPPRQPCLRTSRSSAGWWQDNDLAYVLVVLGNSRVYQRFLTPPGPLT
jgi:hypothetical protein